MWTQASMKLNSMKSLSDKEKKMRVMEAFSKKSSIRDEFSDFFTETSFTAVVKIYNAKGWAKRLTWTVLVLGMVSWLAVQCYWLLDRYFQYPLEVKIELEGAVSLKFPSVTICNLNPIRAASLDDSEYEALRSYKKPPTEDLLFESLQQNIKFESLCTDNQYQCHNGQCIPLIWKCDKIVDCLTKDDERNCDTWTCPSIYFHCVGYNCMDNRTVCDGRQDCSAQQHDELNCGANHTYIPLYSGGSASPSPYSTSPSGTYGSSTPIPVGRRRKREAEEMTANSGHPKHQYFNRMERAWDKMSAQVKKGTISRQMFENFVSRQRRDLRLHQEQIVAYKESKAHHRVKRSGSESSGDSREGINWVKVLGNTTFNKWDQLEMDNSSWRFYDQRDDEYEAAMTYAYVTAILSPERAEQGGHLKKDFIASCKFNGYECSPKNFTYFHSYKFGNCYTFNAYGHNEDLKTNFPGASSGLRLELFLEQEQYVPNLAAEAGARICIHEKGTKPFPEDEGLSVKPQTSTSIGLRQTVLDRLPPPHGDCGVKGESDNYYEIYENFTYTKLSCLKSCYQDTIFESCGCISPVYFILDNKTICNMTDPEIEKCIRKLSTTHFERYYKCDKLCPQPCHDVRFETSLSSAEWPAENYQEFFTARVGKTNSKYLTSKDMDKDFSRVQIYFEDFIYQHIQQQKAYESMNLISDLGGQLGLWLGLSAITIGEICSFLFRLGRSLPNALSRTGRKKEDESKHNQKVGPLSLEEMYEDLSKENSREMIPPKVASPKSLLAKA